VLHLVHPALVHFSVALLVIGAACEVVGLYRRHERALFFGSVLVLAGTATLPFTVATGFLASNVLDLDPASRALVERHERIGLLVLGVFVASQFWKAWFRGRIPEGQRLPYSMLLVVGVVLLAYGALLGGEMVYLHGVGVAGR
jgi:uncharacterized membrane protein